jgi:siroheme synthase
MTVFLVGAGPGDPGLLTVRGRELLAAAEAVLYDGLVDARVLAATPPECLLVDVGKAVRPLGAHAGGRMAAAASAESRHYPPEYLARRGQRTSRSGALTA